MNALYGVLPRVINALGQSPVPQPVNLADLYFRAPPPPHAAIKPRSATLGERLTDVLHKAGVSQHQANRLGDKFVNALEAVTPLGNITGGYQAGQDLKRGNYLAGGLGALLAAAPIPGPGKKAAEALETVFRGVSHVSPRHGNYYTGDREWARQFTQSGQDHEILTRQIPTSAIYQMDTLPLATKPEQLDDAIAEARRRGMKAVRVSEGAGEPPSVFVFDHSIFK